MADHQHVEDFAQLITRIKTEYNVSESEIARRLDVSIATVNNWVHRRRTAPRHATLERIATVFPKVSRADVFAAAGRRTPGPLPPEAKQRLLGLFEQLTAEQQAFTETQLRALAEQNRRAGDH